MFNYLFRLSCPARFLLQLKINPTTSLAFVNRQLLWLVYPSGLQPDRRSWDSFADSEHHLHSSPGPVGPFPPMQAPANGRTAWRSYL